VEIIVPEIIGLLAGEFAYSLRSGLDQLAWQLAAIHKRPKLPRTHTSFPIASVIPAKAFGTTDATRDILPAAIPVIESLQPYNRGSAFQTHPLWILNELCITDKHMIVPLNSASFEARLDGAHPVDKRFFDNGFEVAVPLAEQFYAKFDPGTPEVVFGLPVNVGEQPFAVRIADLRAIHDFVRDKVIPGFARFFA
jgi:hypothetical protein